MMKYFTFCLFILLTSCQFKKAEESSDFIAGHTSASNSFTVQTPSADTYTNGENLNITLSFPLEVTVTGTPRLVLDVGGTTRYATYQSGTGTKFLLFRYTVVAADNDNNGVTLSSLDLNGGTLTYTYNATTSNCDISTVTSRTFSSVLVDNTAPVISSASLTNIAGFYRLGENISFSLVFSEAVTVTGSPRISLANIATVSGTAYANYYSGSGSTTLTFRYTVPNTDADSNGYTLNAVDLNGGTILDAAGLAATLALPALGGTSSALVDFDGRLAYVQSVSPPANGTYVAAQNLDITLEFDRAVTITGSPYIVLTIGSNSRYAYYSSGSGTSSIVFRYTVVNGDEDTDGITIASSITQNGGTIAGTAAPTNSYYTNAQNNSYSVPSTSAILVDAPEPQATSLTISADSTNSISTGTVDNVWIIGQVLEIVVAFNDNMYVTQTGGVPRIPITLTTGTVYATYYSGGDGQTNLIFRYTVQSGDEDTSGGITLASSIDLNGGVIANAANTNAILTLPSSTAPASTSIDGVRPTISSVTPPNNGSYSTVTTPDNNDLNFTLTWSEAVNYSGTINFPITIGASNVNATYFSGNNTSSIVMRYTITAGQTDTDGVATTSPLTGTGSIRDLAGNTCTNLTFTPPNTASVLVDTTSPTISSVTQPTNGTYSTGDQLDFTVNYNEIVNVNTAGGTPRIILTIGGATRYATYTSGSGTSSLLFRYTVVSSELDSDGISVNTTLSNNGGTIRDAGYDNAPTALGAMTTTGILVDSTVPTISSVTFDTGNGTYYSSDNLQFTVTFSESVTIAGSPTLSVTAMNGSLSFTCANGTGTTTTCTYTVASGDYDYNGLASASTLSGGTIEDAANNAATVTFSAPNMSRVFIAHDGLLLWGDVGDSNNRSIAGPVLNSLTDKSGNGNTLTTIGSPTYSGNYLYYDSIDDQMTFAGTLTNAKYVFLAVRTPSLPLTPASQEIFADSIPLLDFNDDTTEIDITLGANTSYAFDCAAEAGPAAGAVNAGLSASTIYISRLNFSAPRTMVGGSVGSISFAGRIGEIMIFDNSPTAGELSNICSYLNAKH